MKMKKYILALGLVSMLIGCNDDFMERYPLDNVTDENFWKTLIPQHYYKIFFLST